MQASVKNCENIDQHLLAAHGLTGCDTVAKLHGIGKGTVIKKLKGGHTLDRLGNLDSSVDEAVMEATKVIGGCCGSKSKDDRSEIRVEMCSKKMGQKNITAASELTRSLADADNRHDAFTVSLGQQTWYHFGSVATFR